MSDTALGTEFGLRLLSAIDPLGRGDRCLATLPAELHNLYGPTEAAIDVSGTARPARQGSEG
jgi:hypothetical protein